MEEGVAYGGAAMLLYFTKLANFIHVLLPTMLHPAWFYFQLYLPHSYENSLHWWRVTVSMEYMRSQKGKH